MRGVSSGAAEIMLESLAPNTVKQYDTYLKRWYMFCGKNNIDYFKATIPEVLTFLTELCSEGAGYGSVNCCKSALVLLLGNKISSDDRVKRFMKGVFRLHPPQPKYNTTWDPQLVLNHLSKLSPNKNLSLENLSKKLVTLLAIVTAHRVQTLSLIKLSNIYHYSDKVLIKISDLIKTSRPGSHQPVLSLPFFKEKPDICPGQALLDYINMTKDIRGGCERLFIAFKKPHKEITSQTISRWIKTTLKDSGIDTSIFTSHSTRHASVSAANRLGVNIDVIRKTAGWSGTSKVFAKFYNRPIVPTNDFARSLVSH
ncbi:uncharacterized protein LOC134660224 [Cydia amplana]|uniref:uncharacterized protein LOC134655283 n=1 Tax=Cydia amplana TaxID=1869771 RepID=UPI002FE52010